MLIFPLPSCNDGDVTISYSLNLPHLSVEKHLPKLQMSGSGLASSAVVLLTIVQDHICVECYQMKMVAASVVTCQLRIHLAELLHQMCVLQVRQVYQLFYSVIMNSSSDQL